MKKAIYAIRKENLIKVIMDKYQGNKAAFSRAVGVHANHINLMCTDNPAIARNLGEDLARRIESALSIPHLWLDTPHGEALKTFTIKAPVVDTVMARAVITCKHYDSMTVTDSWMSKMSGKVTNMESLILCTVATDEMVPKIPAGGTVILDTGVKAVSVDGVYVLTKNDTAFIRYARRESDGSTTLHVSNQDFRSDKPEVLKGMKVAGRIICNIEDHVL